MTEYQLRWNDISSWPENSPKPKKGALVTNKTYPNLDKARKAAWNEIIKVVRNNGSAVIKVYDVSGQEPKYVGDVYGDANYAWDIYGGVMWVAKGEGYESNLVPRISPTTGKTTRDLYRLT